jgi:hypothetical protein
MLLSYFRKPIHSEFYMISNSYNRDVTIQRVACSSSIKRVRPFGHFIIYASQLLSP